MIKWFTESYSLGPRLSIVSGEEIVDCLTKLIRVDSQVGQNIFLPCMLYLLVGLQVSEATVIPAVPSLPSFSSSPLLSSPSPPNPSLILSSNSTCPQHTYTHTQNGRLAGDILQTAPGTSELDTCANLCNSLDSCRSFDYSRLETTCILHSNIEGPYVDPAASYENNFNTPSLRPSQTYTHYEKLGIGNSTTVEFSGLTFTHNRVYYINMRLRNKLGYTNTVSSTGFLVDFSPPTPGRIRNAASDSVRSDGCSASVIVAECIDPSGEPNHR